MIQLITQLSKHKKITTLLCLFMSGCSTNHVVNEKPNLSETMVGEF